MADDATVDHGPNTGIAVYDENPYYWTVDGEPTLLIGGSPKDNLYQHVANPGIDVEAALDVLVDHGGNYVRHTMQSRVNDDAEAAFVVQPFARVDGGETSDEAATYDLDAWNPAYWERFETVLEWTAERDVVMQVTFWDRFDFADHTNHTWSRYNPWNPQNNVTYTAAETGLPTGWEKHPAEEVFPFVLTIEEDNGRLLEYQERYVAKVLEHALAYDHVLYNVSNETRAPKSWGDHWAEFAHEHAVEADAGPAYVTQMYDAWDVTDPEHDRTHEDPGTYDYVDVSQNNQLSGREHYENLTTVRAEFEDRPWPVNNEKCYGRDGGPHGSTAEGLERFWQSIVGASASIRFHRPPSGLGIGETARTHVRAARDVTDELDLATTRPRQDLLANREARSDADVPADHRDETADRSVNGYCLSDGTTHLVLVRDDASTTLDADLPATATVEWYDVAETSWASETRAGSGPVRLSAPGSGYWVTIVRE